MTEVRRLAKAYPKQVVAIGETGMDLFRTGESAKEIQREAFRDHIAVAKELDLPMQIHDRDAHRDVIETLLADGARAKPCSTVIPAMRDGRDRTRARLVSFAVGSVELQGQHRHS